MFLEMDATLGLYHKTFYGRNCILAFNADVNVIVSPFHPSLMFEDKGGTRVEVLMGLHSKDGLLCIKTVQARLKCKKYCRLLLCLLWWFFSELM